MSSPLERAARSAELVLAAGGTDQEIGAQFRRVLAREENPCGASDAKARFRYRLTHWGLGGKNAKVEGLSCADPTCGTFTKLGDLVEVTYRTEKGGDGGVAEYTHEFLRPLPELVYSSGGLVVAGGGYTVTARGIER